MRATWMIRTVEIGTVESGQSVWATGAADASGTPMRDTSPPRSKAVIRRALLHARPCQPPPTNGIILDTMVNAPKPIAAQNGMAIRKLTVGLTSGSEAVSNCPMMTQSEVLATVSSGLTGTPSAILKVLDQR